ncbi:poly [ADP-ribose] polymerase 3-like [Mizuhopecten yessoensis]|uniref:Poly [ADP-ribose] polymerase n=1 Tax=Mizuhopecten yessoensis TaxID=6573 RepID=A0A210PR27_MIZYE|nr:poly [ADP-ribose] polymerase 3-like [Mizuhopecten yessoensis]OWF38950.1 Poly [ADP-ribose] polymerase 3 [Mizuhopecten yessoensis]
MPPKRKAGGATKAGGKKAKTAAATDPGPSTVQDAIASLKSADAGKTKKFKPDSAFPISGCTVYKDYDCMLNQTNIGHNNNKFYVIQVLQQGSNYYAWNRWGRVGDSGLNSMKGPFPDVTKATADFEKKFSDKTKNKWANRENFEAKPGKYTMIEMAGEDEDEVDAAMVPAVSGPTAPCTLDAATQTLMKLIFDHDMFQEAMKNFDIDVKKMPLGKISKNQIAKGFECLDEIEASIKAKKPRNTLAALSSKFYTLIPHNFGRKVPPTIDDLETVRQKMDMLLVLGDIEMAQSLQKQSGDKKSAGKEPHPHDVNYSLLKCKLDLLDKKSKEYQILEKYTNNTRGGYRCAQIKHIWKMDRDGEGDRFKIHDKLTNRKLLWHGTNVAVVAAICKGGLRIMPHSGGRVGSGIYFASENSKSASYVRPAGNIGIMFLDEVVLGKEHHIATDDWTLKAAPPGYDCIIAKGRTEPDPTKDTTLTIEGKKVTVPQGSALSQKKYASSSFSQSEYLVYKESQNRLRYLLMVQF